MQHAPPVQVRHRARQLPKQHRRLQLWQAPRLDAAVQAAQLRELQQQEAALRVVKVREHAHNVRVEQARVDLHLPLKLAHRALIQQRLLRQLLQHKRPPRRALHHAQHLPKLALAQRAHLGHEKVRERVAAPAAARSKERFGVVRGSSRCASGAAIASRRQRGEHRGPNTQRAILERRGASAVQVGVWRVAFPRPYAAPSQARLLRCRPCCACFPRRRLARVRCAAIFSCPRVARAPLQPRPRAGSSNPHFPPLNTRRERALCAPLGHEG